MVPKIPFVMPGCVIFVNFFPREQQEKKFRERIELDPSNLWNDPLSRAIGRARFTNRNKRANGLEQLDQVREEEQIE